VCPPGVPAGLRGTGQRAGEEVIRLAEEELEVGKRTVETGKMRVRRYVTEIPAEAQVTLREERADVVSRAVEDDAYADDVDWSDLEIEVVETAEEAVVDKRARLAEEVVIRIEGTERVETVRDAVRRQQIDVERLPSGTKVVAETVPLEADVVIDKPDSVKSATA
jgi:uncharacterized protein (TIGR02271 family)